MDEVGPVVRWSRAANRRLPVLLPVWLWGRNGHELDWLRRCSDTGHFVHAVTNGDQKTSFYQVQQPFLAAFGGAVVGSLFGRGWLIILVMAVFFFIYCSFRAPCRIELRADAVHVRYGPFGLVAGEIQASSLRLKNGVGTVSFASIDGRRVGMFRTWWYFKNPLWPTDSLVEALSLQYPGPTDRL